MTYTDIVDKLYARYSYQYNRKEIDFLIKQTFDTMIEGLASDGRITIQDFASFTTESNKITIKPSAKMVRKVKYDTIRI